MMAQTDQWRQPMRQWREYFRQWVDVPEPMALMLSSVFFDLRAVHGNAALLTRCGRTLARTRATSLFLGHLRHRGKTRPPLGLFGKITRSGRANTRIRWISSTAAWCPSSTWRASAPGRRAGCRQHQRPADGRCR